MAKTIFFSWQVDTPTRTGRNLLRDVLDQACAEIASDTTIDDALRNELAVDSDTQGEAGQPPIAETIFRKIDSAAVFVADMTFTGKRTDGRPTPNANVLIEYGWALKSLGHARVISVMNEVYGRASRESLPFDLAHVRWPTRFSLPEEASAKQKADVKRELVANLTTAIRTSLATITVPPAQPAPAFVRATAKDGPARFRAAREELGVNEGLFGSSARKVFLSGGPAMWLRLMPSTPPTRTWTTRELKQIAQTGGHVMFVPLVPAQGMDWIRAEDGWGIYSVRSTLNEARAEQIETSSVAFAFRTGEVWSVDTTLLANAPDSMLFVEGHFNERFEEYARFLATLGVSAPYQWAAGMTGVKGRRFHVPPPPGYLTLAPTALCLSETIEMEGLHAGGQTAQDTLRPFYEAIFESCGVKRPAHLP